METKLPEVAPESLFIHVGRLGGVVVELEQKEGIASVEYVRADTTLRLMPIETAPKMRKVIVRYLNSHGKARTVMACYYNPETLELHDDYEGFSTDGYCDEGWYEDHEHDAPLMRLEYEPTHWMPLPKDPDSGEEVTA